MVQEKRSADRSERMDREEWITQFVNVVVWEIQPGLARMIAVTAARDAWPEHQHTSPGRAAREWARRQAGG